MNESSGRDYSYWNLARVVKDFEQYLFELTILFQRKKMKIMIAVGNITSHGLFPVVIQLPMWALPIS